jgi:hypothetical protein
MLYVPLSSPSTKMRMRLTAESTANPIKVTQARVISVSLCKSIHNHELRSSYFLQEFSVRRPVSAPSFTQTQLEAENHLVQA